MRSEHLPDIHSMCFGLNRTMDEQSLESFLRLFGKKRLTSVLIPRMTDDEIQQTVSVLSGIMRHHLSKEEYLQLFLGDR